MAELPRLPYGRQDVDDADVAAVVETLHSHWLTTGPCVGTFENAVAQYVGAQHAVAVSSGTAALHAAIAALGLRLGDEVLVPALTFAATANCVVYQGATPVFCDVEADTLLIDVADVERRITDHTRAIVGVDYAGQPCDWQALRAVAERHDLSLVADACHALGATFQGRKAGTLADLTAFSFHPVKHITTCEGGIVTTDDAERATYMRRFRNHGLQSDHREREERGNWAYDMGFLGFNYRLSDVHCALGTSQLRKLPQWLERRRAIAKRYGAAFARIDGIAPLRVVPGRENAWHLYVVRVDARKFGIDRDTLLRALRDCGIGANVHYPPVHLHSYYRQRYATEPGLCPVAEQVANDILSLPMYPQLADDDVDRVVQSMRAAAIQPQP